MSGGDPKSARILQTIQWFTILLRLSNEMKTKLVYSTHGGIYCWYGHVIYLCMCPLIKHPT